MVLIRLVRDEDLDALYAISLATGNAGADATALYRDPRLIGHIYVGPYAVLTPSMSFLAEDEEGVAGYVVGALDTREWEQRLEREWWPVLRARYPDTADLPAETRTPDECRQFIIHHPETVPQAVHDLYPAHLHMNLLPRLQGRGVGTALLNTWIARAKDLGVSAGHVGVNRSNEKGKRFWTGRGFAEIPLPPEIRSLWLGRRF